MIIAANWKMNLSREQALHHLTRSSQLDVHHAPGHQSVFFVPACYFGMAEEILSSAGAIGWGGQDCHQDEAGAFTGDISADMLLGFGCGTDDSHGCFIQRTHLCKAAVRRHGAQQMTICLRM